MTCPDCGHLNLDGVDSCEHCSQDLRSVDVPRPGSGLQGTIMKTPLKDLNPAPALTVELGERVSSVIHKMQKGRQGSVLVVDRGRLMGIFTERDALNRLAGRRLDLDAIPVADVMTPDPKTLRGEDTIAFAMHRMAVGGYRHIPIVEEGSPLRFVSVRGLLRYLHEHTR